MSLKEALDDEWKQFKINSSDRFTGKAFIIFKTQFQADYAGKVLNSPDFLEYIHDRLLCKKQVQRQFAGNTLRFSKAAEPDDYFWENLNISFMQRVVLKAVTYGLSLILIGVASLGIYYAMQKKKEYEKASIESTSSEDWFKAKAVSACIGLSVSAINSILKTFIQLSSRKEKDATYTNHNISLASKMLFATFVNTALIPIIIYNSIEDWFTSYGLVFDIIIYALVIAFIKPVIDLVHPDYLRLLLLRRYQLRLGSKSKLN